MVTTGAVKQRLNMDEYGFFIRCKTVVRLHSVNTSKQSSYCYSLAQYVFDAFVSCCSFQLLFSLQNGAFLTM